MLLIIYVESFIEKFYSKVLPGAIKAMFAPLFTILLIYNRVVGKMKVVYPFYESVIIKKPKKVNV